MVYWQSGRSWMSCAICLLGWQVPTAAVADYSIQAEQTVFRLPRDAERGKLWITVRGVNLWDASIRGVTPKLVLKDSLAEKTKTPIIKFPESEVEPDHKRGEIDHSWRVRVDISNLAPNTHEKRWLILKYGRYRDIQEYTLTNRVEGSTLAWTVTNPIEERTLSGNYLTTLTIVATGTQTVQPRIHSVILQDADTKEIFDPNLTFDPEEPTIKPGTAEAVQLGVEELPASAGSYEGKVFIISKGSDEIKEIDLLVHFTRKIHALFGVLCILVGVGLSSFVNNYARNRMKRLSGLQAATVLQARLPDLERTLRTATKKTGMTFPLLDSALNDLKDKLSEDYLQASGLLGFRFFLGTIGLDQAS